MLSILMNMKAILSMFFYFLIQSMFQPFHHKVDGHDLHHSIQNEDKI